MCYYLRRMIKCFNNKMESVSHLSLDDSIETYVIFKKLITKFDEEVSFLMFTTTLFNVCTMYFGIMSVLRSTDILINVQHISVWCYFIASYASFIAMTSIASLVYEANMNALEILKELAFKKFSVTVSPKQFLLIEANQVSLTVWNIFPIRRNFIFGTLGAMFTYCILLDSLQNNR
ncbi:uncharacterized protein TNIN_3791 [Trichonephila inaurata madagascariensis]|uniref:Uncharacterized protein n=1 Tax=Trichonephila inaurata madagascariensis TaxID=2747483 RepID=A0A8X7CCK9_9ARAC|nr:uncharacterized protein TNIN_3791 [Trichonephila inaurata madagascariensis]